MRIAFQGEAGCNGDELCSEAFPGHDAVPHQTFLEAFTAVKSGDCDLGLLAMENSSAGRVADVHALLPGCGLNIVGELYKRVKLFLMAPEGTAKDPLRVARSHPMALAQCSEMIARLNLRGEATLDTAGAARALAEAPEPGVAAIATQTAARLYDLRILAAGENDVRNVTRFIVVSNGEQAPAELPDGPSLTSLFFTTRDVPAALYKALGAFAINGVNLLKLESYMEGQGHFRAARFYIEVEGRPSDEPLRQALEELAFFSSEYSIAGVYAASPSRKLGDLSRTASRPPRAGRTSTSAGETPEPDDRPYETLSKLRQSIDNIDAAVVHLLAERFRTTEQVGVLKAQFLLASSDGAREREQIKRLRRLAEASGLDPAFAEKVLGFIIQEVVRKHDAIKADWTGEVDSGERTS